MAIPTKAQGITRYFDYNPQGFIAFPDNTLNVYFYYDIGDLDSHRFVVRPRVDAGGVSLTLDNEETNSQDLWTNMPHLSFSKKVKLIGDFLFTKLWFEVLDTKEGKVYETGSHNIWNGKLLLDYINQLNDSLLK